MEPCQANYTVGEAVEIWSLSKQTWIAGEIEAISLNTEIHGQYAIEAGTMRVKYSGIDLGSYKYIPPRDYGYVRKVVGSSIVSPPREQPSPDQGLQQERSYLKQQSDAGAAPRNFPSADVASGYSKSLSRPSCLQIGVHTETGMKPDVPNWVSQDSYLEKHLRDGLVLVGVIDGHGDHGTQIANRIKNLFAEKAHSLASARDTEIPGIFQKSFASVAAQLKTDGFSQQSGATATFALVDHDLQKVSIAHVGDATALLVTPGGAIAYQTIDHRPSSHNEAMRLQAHGTQIIDGRLRNHEPEGIVSYGFSRSMGDVGLANRGVTSEPEITCQLPFRPGSVLIIASDGVWDMLPKNVVASTALASRPREAANLVVRNALQAWVAQGFRDDITAIVVKNASSETPSATNLVSAEIGSPASTQPALAQLTPLSLQHTPKASPAVAGTFQMPRSK